MEYIFHSVVKEESLHIYQGKKKTYGCWKGTPLHPLCDSTSLPWVDGSISSTVALRLRCCVLQHILNFDPHWGWPSLGKREWTSSQSCSKWAGDAFTAYIWDCGQPPPFSTGSENGLVIWLLDWKMNAQSPLSSNWTLAPTDVATIRPVPSDPVWNLLLQRPFFFFFQSSCSLWTCPCALLLSEPHRLALLDEFTSSPWLIWHFRLNLSWLRSPSEWWVSLDLKWSQRPYREFIKSKQTPANISGKGRKTNPWLFFWVSELFSILWISWTYILLFYISVYLPCLTDSYTELCHVLHLGLSSTHEWCPNCTPTRPHTDMIWGWLTLLGGQL